MRLVQYFSIRFNLLLEKLAMVASTVSSKLIGAMAAKEGFKFVESLTGQCTMAINVRVKVELFIGFKYIGNAARTLEAEGYNVLFGYEEAIGFMLGEEVRDKDGVSATVSALRVVSRRELIQYFRCALPSWFLHFTGEGNQQPII